MHVDFKRGELVELTNIVGVFEGRYSKLEREHSLVIVLNDTCDPKDRTMVLVFGKNVCGKLQSFYVRRARLKRL